MYKSTELKHRILKTLTLLAIVRVGMYIPIPGVDWQVLKAVFRDSPNTLFGYYDFFAGGSLSQATIFALGIMPYISGSILILLLSGVVPRLRQLRDGSIEQNLRFDRLILVMTIIISVLQAYGVAIFLENMISPFGVTVVPNPGLRFQLLVVLSLTTGTIVLVCIASLITAKGIGNGVALIILTNLILNILSGIIYEFKDYQTGLKTGSQEVFFIVLFVGLLVLTIIEISSKRKLTLQFRKQSSEQMALVDWAPSIPIRMNTAGIVPINVAIAIMLIPNTLTIFLDNSGFSQSLQNWFSLGHPFYWIALGLMIIILSYLYTAATFSPTDLVNRVRQYGYTIKGMNPNEEELIEEIDKMVEKWILPGALFLIVIASAPYAVTHWLDIHPQLAELLGPSLLIITAIGLDFKDQMVGYLKMHRTIPGEKNQNDREWVSIFSGKTKLDAEMVRGILYHKRIDSVVCSNRVISAIGTLAFWEICQPPFPSLTVHRRLGGGQVLVKVPSEIEEEAHNILKAHNIRTQ